MEFQTIEIDFPAAQGTQYRSVGVRQAFNRKIARAAVALVGYTFTLAGSREVKDIVVRLRHEIHNQPTTITPEIYVVATLGIQDASGYYNDPFTGKVTALIMYELEPGGPVIDDGRVGNPLLEVIRDPS